MPTVIPFPTRSNPPVHQPADDPVRLAYDALAPAYDAFTAGYRHDLWLPAIERIAIANGLRGQRLLDVACGTGKSFIPLLERGYAVTGCDLSLEMLRRAECKAPAARLVLADMRALPALGSFDLVTCLDDALNYLLHAEQLRATFEGIARHLAPAALAVWDVSTLSLLRSSFSNDWVADRGEWFVGWHGMASSGIAAGAVVEARIDAFRRRGSTWTRSTSRHRQRHWPLKEVTQIAGAAGLRVLEVLGQHRGARLENDVDEHRHIKALFVACRAERPVEPPRGRIDPRAGRET